MTDEVLRIHSHQPLSIHHAAGGSVTVRYRIHASDPVEGWKDAEGTFEPGKSVTTNLLSPLPSSIEIDYFVTGTPGSHYLITTEFHQIGRYTRFHSIEGSIASIGEEGPAHHRVSLVASDPSLSFSTARGKALGEALSESLTKGTTTEFTPSKQLKVRTEAELAAARPDPLEGAAPAPEGVDYPVWFATHRRPLLFDGRVTGFSAERDTHVHYGQCHVSVPKSHKIGSVGSGFLQRLRTQTDDRLSLVRIDPSASGEQFWVDIKAILSEQSLGERDAVVFVHGYNVSFESAMIRAAQIGYDLGIGLMSCYSWPSQGTLLGYQADEASIDASDQYIAEYLSAMVRESGAERVHIIAHSMGNRGLLRAVNRIAASVHQAVRRPFTQIILAAADVDRSTFEQLSAAYREVADQTTMYVCDRDFAVRISRWLHGYDRVGFAPPVVVVPNVHTVNVSHLDLTGLGHSYAAELKDVLQDMYRVIKDGSPPERRFGLRPEKTTDGLRYWLVGA